MITIYLLTQVSGTLKLHGARFKGAARERREAGKTG